MLLCRFDPIVLQSKYHRKQFEWQIRFFFYLHFMSLGKVSRASVFYVQDLEEMGNELGPLHDQLDEKVSRLTYGLSDGSLANHVHDAEEHAKQLNDSAAILDR